MRDIWKITKCIKATAARHRAASFVKQGDTVKKGDKLLEVDINSIHEKGYSLETPVLVTNADDYADVIEMASGSVKAGAPLLTALK